MAKKVSEVVKSKSPVKLSDLKTQRRNINKHKPHGIAGLQNSIQADGLIGGITVAADGEAFDGSARLETIAEKMPNVKVRVIDTEGDTLLVNRRVDIPNADHPRARRLGYAANAIAVMDWNPDAELLDQLAQEDEVVAALVKQEDESLKALKELAGAGGTQDAEPQIDRADELLKTWKVERGQLWGLGEHRLICGDSTDRDVVSLLLGDSIPGMMVTDPPYGVEYDANWRNEAAEKGLISHAAIRVGRVEQDDRIDWSEAYKLFPGDVVYCWHAGRHASEVQASLEIVGFEIRCQVIWGKQTFAISRGHYHWQHEPCWYAVRKGKSAKWGGDRSQSTLWDITWDKNVEGGHSTQKPLECMARPIRNHNFSSVYDPFVGSGTTIMASENTGKTCFACEISPAYISVCLQRYLDATGKTPVLLNG